ncbi:MAG: (2Fe-2S)-binding protein [Chlamydiae bacterium]|nr:(2Fe-2S)-binding protein [Chlamydiota bacterium]
MAKIIFVNTNEEVELPDGSPIQEVCEKAGIPFACSEGICGSCIIEVIEGMNNLTDPTQAEKDFFGEVENERLACQCKIKKGTVKIRF